MDAVRPLERLSQYRHLAVVVLAALAAGDAEEDLGHALRAAVTGGAAAARLVFQEPGEHDVEIDDAGAVVDEDDAAAAHDHLLLAERLRLEGQLQRDVRRQDAGQRRARLHRLQRPPLLPGRGIGGVVELAEREAERQLDDADALDVAGDAEELGAAVCLGADRLVELHALLQHERDVGVALDVVDVRRLGEDAGVGGEGRADARHPALVVERGEQPRLLAADVRPGAAPDREVERNVAAEHVLAEQAALPRLLDRLLHPIDRQRVLVAQVDVPIRRAGGVGGDNHPFDHSMRIALHQDAIDPRSGVALIGVADQVLRLALLAAQKLPLGAGREVGAAAAAQGRLLHRLDQLFLAHRQGAGEAGVAAGGDVVVDVIRVDDAAAGEQPPLLHRPEVQVRES